jgi:carbon storage regulator
MLVLSRKIGERIVVPQCELIVTVLELSGNHIRLGFSAPEGVRIFREEVWRENQQPARGSPRAE